MTEQVGTMEPEAQPQPAAAGASPAPDATVAGPAVGGATVGGAAAGGSPRVRAARNRRAKAQPGQAGAMAVEPVVLPPPSTGPLKFDLIDADERNEVEASTPRRWRLPKTDGEIRRAIILPALVLCLLGSFYWIGIASNRYVSEAHVLIQKTGLPGGGGVDFTGLLTGVTSSGNRPDQMRMRDYMLSVDMLKKLDAELHLRQHYSDPRHDPITRLWSPNASMEDFQSYFNSRVKIDLDDSLGDLVITAQAYDPQTAQAIISSMIRDGEAYMNRSDHDLVRAQVDFLEGEAVRSNQRNIAARQALINYQNKAGLLSPEQSAERLQGIVAQLEARRTALETQLRERQAYLVSTHPDVISVRQQIEAVNQQIANESGKVVSAGGGALNRKAATFDRLQQDAVFANQVYQTTLTALEKGRIDAMRMVQKVSVVQQPTRAEKSIQPRRLYNATVFSLVTLLAAGIILLLTAIIRDHVD